MPLPLRCTRLLTKRLRVCINMLKFLVELYLFYYFTVYLSSFIISCFILLPRRHNRRCYSLFFRLSLLSPQPTMLLSLLLPISSRKEFEYDNNKTCRVIKGDGVDKDDGSPFGLQDSATHQGLPDSITNVQVKRIFVLPRFVGARTIILGGAYS